MANDFARGRPNDRCPVHRATRQFHKTRPLSKELADQPRAETHLSRCGCSHCVGFTWSSKTWSHEIAGILVGPLDASSDANWHS